MGLSATMPKARGHGIEGVQALKDQIIGPSGWREVLAWLRIALSRSTCVNSAAQL